MSYRDTRIYICDVCGREEEGQVTREKQPNGALFFELPTGWNLFEIPKNAVYCEQCAGFFREVKQQAKESK